MELEDGYLKTFSRKGLEVLFSEVGIGGIKFRWTSVGRRVGYGDRPLRYVIDGNVPSMT